MKRWGQINYLIYQNHQLEIGFYDNLPQVQLLDAQAESKDFYSVQFPKTEVKVLSQEDDFIECEISHSRQKIKETPQNFYHYRGKDYISDITTYQPPLKENEIVAKNSRIAELEANVSELQEAANLNLVKAQEIVNELKEIVNAQ